MSFRALLAPRILPVLTRNLLTRYPCHDAHLYQGEAPQDAAQRHPAFGNCFDWHSSVHSHRTLLQILDDFPATDDAKAARQAAQHNLTQEKLAAEADYCTHHRSYERPYGWAWLMTLAATLKAARHAWIRDLAAPLQCLVDVVAKHTTDWLSAMPQPVRHGVHSNSAFALGLLRSAAITLRHAALVQQIERRAHEWFDADRNWPGEYEGSGYDFLSPGLAEADLMSRLLDADDFLRWWNAFLPNLRMTARMLAIVHVANVDDGHLVHGHGLNLSRAGMLCRIAGRLLEAGEDRAAAPMFEQALQLYAAGLEHSIEGPYASTHWLATFAWDAAGALDEAARRGMLGEPAR